MINYDYIKHLLKKANYDPAEFKIGIGETSSKGSYTYDAGKYMSTNITAKYAIKYFRDNNFYVIWHRNIRNTAGKLISRQYFSVNADDVREIDYNGTVIKKARGDKEQETVYVCKAENILKYLQELTKQ